MRKLRNAILGCLLIAPASLAIAADPKSPGKDATSLMLLPTPKKIEMRTGAFEIQSDTRLFLPPAVERPEQLAIEDFEKLCLKQFGLDLMEDRLGKVTYDGSAIHFEIDPGPAGAEKLPAEGYEIVVSPTAVLVRGNDSPGLFYAIQTLKQIVRSQGRTIPCLKIVDSPTFPNRGFYHDVTRGKVPKLDTLKEIVDHLAEWKINQLQLYVEHTFAFRFDPKIAENCSPLTPEEILELDAYCRDRRVNFVPSLQSTGHLGHILSLPQYRAFADVETTNTWERMAWPQKMRGLTIDTRNPAAMHLLEQMYDEFLPLFTSPYFNACSDETYDLGMGKNKEVAEKIGPGRLYLDHIEHLNAMSKSYGKTLMIWGDIVKKYPDLIPDIPKDIVLLDWGYGANTKFENCKLFEDAGLRFYVCPGTSGWNRIINGIGNADLNIRGYAAAGAKYGAIGILNTDWGDYGHYNFLSGSWHGMALGGEMGWNVDGAKSPEEFDKAWTYAMFGDPDGTAAATLRKITAIGDVMGTWIMFQKPFAAEYHRGYYRSGLAKVSDDDLVQLKQDSGAAAALFEGYLRQGRGNPQDVAELAHGSKMTALMAEKLLIERQIVANEGAIDAALAARLRAFVEEGRTLLEQYEKLWRARSKESNLRDIRHAFDALFDQSLEFAAKGSAK